MFSLFLFAISTTNGQVFTNVFLRDSNTPIEMIEQTTSYQLYDDIMVGSKLKIVISSDSTDYLAGDIGLEELYWPFCSIVPHQPLTAAGIGATFKPMEEPGVKWYSFATGPNRQSGDWFIADFNAIEVGYCNLAFYDYAVSFEEPAYYLCFTHVPTRDFNNDYMVNFLDYKIFASHWQETNCANSNCWEADVDTDGDVDIADLELFCDFWLEKTK
jgi:hypothetical protein